MEKNRDKVPSKNLEPKQLVVDNQGDVKEWPVIRPNRTRVAFIQKLPNALREHPWDVGEGVNCGVLEYLKAIVVNKLSVERIEKCERRYRKDAKQQQPFTPV